METPPPPLDPAASAILRGKFGENWRSWAWFRSQWTKLSLTVLGALVTTIIGIGGWALTLKTRVVVLETQVVPVLKSDERLVKVEAVVIEHDARITSMERNYEYAKQEAGTAPTPRRARK